MAPAPRVGRRLAVLASSYVLGCSVFGLLIPTLMAGPILAWYVWSASWLADTVFVLGTLGAFFAARRALDLAGPITGIATAFVLEWLVFGLSFAALPLVQSAESRLVPVEEILPFVVRIGWPGLLFAAIAPLLMQRYLIAKPSRPDSKNVIGTRR